MDKTIEELEAELKSKTQAQNEAYAKAKAESETKEFANIVTDPSKTLNTKLSQKLAEKIDTSKEVDDKVAETTELLVDKGLQAQKNKATASVILSEDETLEADYQKNKDEYMYHGIDHKIDKEWKRKIIHTINDIWFIIWAFVGFFTIVPVSTFLSRVKALKGIVKGLAIVLGILMLLSILAGLTYATLKWSGVIH